MSRRRGRAPLRRAPGARLRAAHGSRTWSRPRSPPCAATRSSTRDHWDAKVKPPLPLAPGMTIRFEVLDRRPAEHAALHAHGGGADVDVDIRPRARRRRDAHALADRARAVGPARPARRPRSRRARRAAGRPDARRGRARGSKTPSTISARRSATQSRAQCSARSRSRSSSASRSAASAGNAVGRELDPNLVHRRLDAGVDLVPLLGDDRHLADLVEQPLGEAGRSRPASPRGRRRCRSSRAPRSRAARAVHGEGHRRFRASMITTSIAPVGSA